VRDVIGVFSGQEEASWCVHGQIVGRWGDRLAQSSDISRGELFGMEGDSGVACAGLVCWERTICGGRVVRGSAVCCLQASPLNRFGVRVRLVDSKLVLSLSTGIELVEYLLAGWKVPK
jgi:hypothetical protein